MDTAQDVVKAVGGETITYQPIRSSWGDINGLSVAYDASSLRISTSLRVYKRLEGAWFTKFQSSKGVEYFAVTSLSTKTAPTLQSNKSGGYIQCEGLTVSRTDRGITMHIPTACIDSPWRVKVGVGTEVYGPSGSDRLQYTDDALSNGRTTSYVRRDPSDVSKGPWVDQG